MSRFSGSAQSPPSELWQATLSVAPSTAHNNRMRTYLLRIALALLTFVIGLATNRLSTAVHHRAVPGMTASQNANVIPPPAARARRFWPEPRSLDLEFVGTETLVYDGYLVKRFYKTARIEDAREEAGRLKPVEVEVSYGRLAKNGKILATFDAGAYHPMGNATDFGLFSLLGTETKQLVVSQSIWRGGQYWIVSLTPPARIIFCSGDWDVGRGDNIRAIDIDNDGVDEIVDETTAFYDLQDKLTTMQIPLPEVIFKYDAKSKKYLPANNLHQDYLLRDMDAGVPTVSPPDNFNHLSDVLKVTLRLIYAGREDEGWAFYDKSYKLADKEEIRARVMADLREDSVHQFLYTNRNSFKQTAELSLPDSLRSKLDRRFPGWHYLKVDDEITSFLRESVSPHARPDLISGDFDGNGLLDYAALIEQEKSDKNETAAESQVSLVVFLRTAAGFKMHLIDPDGGYLGLMKRGEWDYDYETQQHFTYPHDAIFTGIFEKGGSSYIYENKKFRSIITSD